MTEINPPSYLEGGCFNATQDRRVWASVICSEGVAFGACPDGGLEVNDSATGGLTVEVLAGAAFIEGDIVACQGMYHVVNDAPVDLTLTPSDPTDDRTDLIIAHVHDSQFSGATDEWHLEVVTGVPGGGTPAVPDSALLLAQIVVPGGATEITDADITDQRVGYMLCSGGTPELVTFETDGPQTFVKGNFPGARAFKVTAVGGGGGGGGTPNVASGESSAGGGGGAGGSVIQVFTPEDLPETVNFTVGDGGATGSGSGGVGINGSPGGTTDFNGLTANGGAGGLGGTASGAGAQTRSGGSGGTASGGFTTRGGAGSPGIRIGGVQAASGPGGTSLFGGGGSADSGSGGPGQVGVHGGGGGGAMGNDGDSNNVGGIGGTGVVFIEVL